MTTQTPKEYTMPSIMVNNEEWIRKIDHDTLLSRGEARGRREERERIRLLFKQECDKNLKGYGGAFVDYSFEHTALTPDTDNTTSV